jgi:hypothetical protein
MWEPGRLTTLWASTTYYRDGFTLYLYIEEIERKGINGNWNKRKGSKGRIIKSAKQ